MIQLEVKKETLCLSFFCAERHAMILLFHNKTHVLSWGTAHGGSENIPRAASQLHGDDT
jgi:hypothetical protein